MGISRALGSAFSAGALTCVLVALSCTGGSGSGGFVDAGPTEGGLGVPPGGPCEKNEDCPSQLCVAIPTDGGTRGFCAGACEGVPSARCTVSEAGCLPGWVSWSLTGRPPRYCRCDPKPEACDGADDDCNGVVDDQPAADTWCASVRPGSACEGRACKICPARCDGACTSLTDDLANCGACGTVCPQASGSTFPACSDDGCKSLDTLLALESLGVLWADAASIYFVDFETRSIQRCPKSGCTSPELLVENVGYASRIRTDATHIYWMAESAIRRCPIAGCGGAAPELVSEAESNHQGFVLVGDDIVFAVAGNSLEQGRVSICPKTGCAGAPTNLADGLEYPDVPFVADGVVYWVHKNTSGFEDDADGSVLSCPLTGCGNTPKVIVENERVAEELVVAGGNVYFTTGGYSENGVTVVPSTIKVCPVGGCAGAAPSIHEASPSAPIADLQLLGSELFWVGSNETAERPPQVKTCAAASCQARVLASLANVERTPNLAVDGATLWLAVDGKITKLAR